MTKHVALRLPDDAAAAIDQRREQVGLSRNEWIVNALRWVLEQPVVERTEKVQI